LENEILYWHKGGAELLPFGCGLSEGAIDKKDKELKKGRSEADLAGLDDANAQRLE